VRVSARARRLRFVIRPNSGLEVVTPRGISQARIEEGLRSKAQWILTTGARMAQQTTPTPTPLTAGRILPSLGQRLLLIVHTGAPRGRFRAALTALAPSAPSAIPSARPTPTPAKRPEAAHGLTQGRLDLAPPVTSPTSAAAHATPSATADTQVDADGALTLTVASADEPTVRAALEAWYRRQAQTIVTERLALWNQRYGFTYHRVTIKEQKTRWGSCSRQGNLNFNWRLLLAPLDILDYVLIHELSHLKEQNHSPRFWAVVALACPEYRARRHWLREHGQELRF
jgi:predicted metal-dependent hydrolase